MVKNNSCVASTKEEALKLGLIYYQTHTPCKRGHLAPRLANRGTCVECNALYKKRYYQENRDKALSDASIYYLNNREYFLQYKKQHYLDNFEIYAAKGREYRASNKEKAAEYNKEYRKTNYELLRYKQKQYINNNRGAVNEYHSRRRKQVKQAIVPWTDFVKIAELYEDATLLKITGVSWHVDHIIPLKHPLVCGLHVLDNLQLLPAIENIRKNNKFDVESYVHELPKINNHANKSRTTN